MDFSLTHQQQMIVDTARGIGAEYGLDYWRECDAKKQFPKAFWKSVCDSGLSAPMIPEDHGGAGLGMFETALIVEALAASGGGSTVGQLFMINTIFGCLSISRFGGKAMRETLLPRLMSGEINCCMALTEPDAGSNSLEMKTFAERDGDGWRVNGQKHWITAVDQSDKMLLIARTTKFQDAPSKTFGVSMFLIDVKREGLSFTPVEKLGTNTLASCTVFLDNVRIGADELIGTLDQGWRELLDVLNTERIVTAAGLVGCSELAMSLAVTYGNERRVFGRTPVSAYQGIQFPLAQAYAENECARIMNYKAASLYDTQQPYGSEANIAKLIAAQAAAAATERAMQTMGGMGYSKEYHVERLWRDARLFRFAPISEEMILNFIAMQNLGMPRSY